MKPNRKPDQYYIDQYDRMTILELKPLEESQLQKIEMAVNEDEKHTLAILNQINEDSFENRIVLRARYRKITIDSWIREDAAKDTLIKQTPIPLSIECETCKSLMTLCDHFFNRENIPILFIFECPNKHSPKKVIYPDGREYFFPTQKCADCGYEIISKETKENNILIMINTCTICGKITEHKLDLNFEPEPEYTITEEERKKYCQIDPNQKTPSEHLTELLTLLSEIDKDAKERNVKDD